MKQYRPVLAAAAILFLTFFSGVVAQITTLPASTGFINMMVAQGKPPVATGGTIGAGSTDAAGVFNASATSGTIAFVDPNTAQASCIVTDSSASPVIVYSMAAAQIVLTTIVSGHTYYYHCFKRVI